MPNWLKGKKVDRTKYPKLGHFVPHSEETKKHWSKIRKGRHLSEETKRKVGAFWRGKKRGSFSEEHRKKLSEALKNRPSRLVGYRHSEETRKKMSNAKKDFIPWNKGLKGYRAREKSHLWKGGITPLKRQIRVLFEYKQWRKIIFERDNWICQECKQRGGKLNVDHYPKSFTQIFYENNINSLDDAMNCQELWNINNGRTLCEKCHKKTATYLNGGRYKSSNNKNI